MIDILLGFFLGIAFMIDVLIIFFLTDLLLTRNRCVIKGTRILTKKGEKYIEELSEGDILYDNSKVLKLKSCFVKEIYEINGELKVSSTHLLLTNEGWKKAKHLKEGNFVFKQSKFILVNKIEKLKGEFGVYDVCVSNSHTFYANKYLTHNKSI